MDRETLTIVTPFSKEEVVLKTYLTGREKRDIANTAMPTDVQYDEHEGVRGINALKIINDGQDMALRTVIVSINGKNDIDFVSAVLDMRSVDSDYIIAKVKEVVDGITEEKKTK